MSFQFIQNEARCGSSRKGHNQLSNDVRCALCPRFLYGGYSVLFWMLAAVLSPIGGDDVTALLRSNWEQPWSGALHAVTRGIILTTCGPVDAAGHRLLIKGACCG